MTQEGKCQSHSMFERMLTSSIDNLAEKFSQWAEEQGKQSAANGVALQKVLDNQADRRELCGKQGSRIDALVSSDTDQWEAINYTRKMVNIGIGLVLCGQLLVAAVGAILFKHIMG